VLGRENASPPLTYAKSRGRVFGAVRVKNEHISNGRLRRVRASLRVKKDRKAAWKKLQADCSDARARACEGFTGLDQGETKERLAGK
jgi:hypothetical protein